MKRFILFLSIVAIFIACNQHKDSEKTSEKIIEKDSVTTPVQDTVVKDTGRVSVSTNSDSTVLFQLTQQLLTAAKNRDYLAFAAFIHPQDGIRFSPYAYIDTATYEKETKLFFTKNEFLRIAAMPGKKNWLVGFDASDAPTQMSLNDYFKRFVYDVDFVNAPQKSINTFLGGGNSLNNLRKIYPDDPFIENYFSGFDKTREGMDWRTLRLVFRKAGAQYYLIAMVHDEWTI